MAELNATNLFDLPSDPLNGGNVSLSISEHEQPADPTNNNQPLSLDQSTISQIVSGLQQASRNGATSLPSRDIQMTSSHLAADEQTQLNYVPQPQRRDYVDEYNNQIDSYYRAENQQKNMDNIYDEIQAPLLMAILYFLFQLPIFKRTLFNLFPVLCHHDGNYNVYGLLTMCALFGGIYYMFIKTMKSFSRF